jgi:hypothetical protein
VQCRLEAVATDASAEFPEGAQGAFDQAAEKLDRPGAFDNRAIIIDLNAFAGLTGFSPGAGETMPASAVKRAAEASTPGRVQALAACRGRGAADYLAVGAFLRVCAAFGLAIRVDPFGARGRR